MATRTTAKIVGGLAGATVLAASFGSAASARIPENGRQDARPVHAAAVAVPDAFERAVARRLAPKRVAAKAPVLDASKTDVFRRAIAEQDGLVEAGR